MAKEKDESGAATGGYPYSSLQQCLKLGTAVYDHGGEEVPKHLIADSLGMNEGSSGLYQLTASAKSFGIVDGTKELSLTDGGRLYFQAANPATQRIAMLGFLIAPPKFKMLVDRYDGSNVPSPVMLTSVLQKHGVPESWASRAASLFLSTATELGVIDDSGCLRFKATLHKAEKIAVPTAEDQDKDVGQTPHLPSHKGFRPYYGDSVPTAAQPPVAVAGQNKSNAWVFTEAGGTVRLETPDPLPKALWARLTKYVAMLEPNEEKFP